MVLRYFISLVLVGIGYSCTTSQEAISQQESSVFAGTFMVDMLYGQRVKEGHLNLKINDRTSKISGFSGCNTYSVGFTISGNTITFTPAMGTKIYCEEAAMEKEHQFLNIFASPKEFRIKKDTLIFYHEGTEIVKATRFVF